MTDYLYAIIPYQGGVSFTPHKGETYVYCPEIPEFKDIESEFVEPEGLNLFADFLMINTCYRQSEFTGNSDGYSWLRVEIYKIAKALGAKEVWYVAELATDEMFMKDFSFNNWIRNFKTGEKSVVELNMDFIKGNVITTYYHDDFSDIILEKP